jgi:hypothetical protein
MRLVLLTVVAELLFTPHTYRRNATESFVSQTPDLRVHRGMKLLLPQALAHQG